MDPQAGAGGYRVMQNKMRRVPIPSASTGFAAWGARLAFAVSLAAALFWLPAQADTPPRDAGTILPLTEVTVIGSGIRHRFTAEFAANALDREKGLMFRPSLPRDGAMLFDFEVSRPVAMWMKNTLISLDMLFVAADGRIVNIAIDTEPFSLQAIRSDGPVRAVLEVNAGTARRLGIRPGDRLEHGIFSQAGEAAQ